MSNESSPGGVSDNLTLITGANGGIGQFVLRHLLATGRRRVICHYRQACNRIDELFEEFGIDSNHAYRADLCDEDAVNVMRGEIEDRHGAVCNLINVAGSSSNAMVWKLDSNEFVRVVNDSLLSTFHCCKAFIPPMRQAGYGRIVNFSSIVGSTGVVGAAHYAAAKAGLTGFTKSIAAELANRGVTANALALGYFDAGLIDSVPEAHKPTILAQIPIGRFGNQADVGSAVEYLISPQASFVTGQTIHLNGGQF